MSEAWRISEISHCFKIVENYFTIATEKQSELIICGFKFFAINLKLREGFTMLVDLKTLWDWNGILFLSRKGGAISY